MSWFRTPRTIAWKSVATLILFGVLLGVAVISRMMVPAGVSERELYAAAEGMGRFLVTAGGLALAVIWTRPWRR